jgi:ABC-type sugar transport system ATPase subunit
MGFAVHGLTKAYGGVGVLNDVDLAVQDGEIHALLGANGAGKSTLIKCLGGAIRPDAGRIVIGEKTFDALTPREAHDAGVAIIYQDLSMAGSLSVAENIYLGQELRRGPFIRKREQRARARKTLNDISSDLNPDTPADELRGADQQVVEIAKALTRKSTLLVLDEPTAALTDAEVRKLMTHILTLKARRFPILYVTHRLNEVFTLADRVTVLRDGNVVLERAVGEVSRDQLVDAIVGATGVTEKVVDQSTTGAVEPVVLETMDLVAPGIGPIDLKLYYGEILAIFGLVGSGRTEFLEAIFTGRRNAGEVFLDGKAFRARHPADAIAAGVALVPSERLRKSLFRPLTGLDNVMLPGMLELAFGPLRRRSLERREFLRVAEQLSVRPPAPRMEAVRFSGGNQQKLVVGRWLRIQETLKVLLLDEPTQGVDVGARADLYRSMENAVAGRQCGLIVTSSDEEEVEHVAHRAVVLSRGVVVGELRQPEITQRALLELAHAGESSPEAKTRTETLE